MKHVLVSLSCLALGFSSTLFAQDYNRLSIEAHGGFNRPMGYLSAGSSISLAAPFSAGGGIRYMATSSFGVRLSYMYNSFQFENNNTTINTTLHAGTGEALVNLGRLCRFEEFSNHLGLMLHGGIGGGSFSGRDTVSKQDRSELLGHFMAGVTPMVKLTEKISLMADLSIYGNVRQFYTMDFLGRTRSRGFDGYYSTLTLGLSISLGKNEKNIDWKYMSDAGSNEVLDSMRTEMDNVKAENESLRARVAKIESDMKDDDKDGVENHLDLEPNSKPGAAVDTKGREITFPEFDDLIPDTIVGTKLFFTVQLGVYSRALPEKFWRSIAPIYKLKIEDGTLRYFTGIYHSVEETNAALVEAKRKGITDAFITAYYKGRRITVAEAEIILKTKGPDVLRPKP